MHKVVLACSSQKAVLKTQILQICKEEKYILCCLLTSCSVCSHSGNLWICAGHPRECRRREFRWLEREALESLPLNKLNPCLNLWVVSNKVHPMVGLVLILRCIMFGAKRVDSLPSLKVEVVSLLWYIRSLLSVSVSAVVVMFNVL